MIERRYQGTSVRADGNTIRGTASVVYDGTAGSEYELWPNTFERIAPGAFDEALKSGADVVALWNHDPNIVLGRTPDTLHLSADGAGLHYQIDPPDTTAAKDLLHSIARGDVRQSSFAFLPTKVEWTKDGDRDVRTVRGAKLFDVSPVTHAAYSGTSVGLRSEERRTLEQERDDFRNRIATERIMKRWEEIADQE